MLLRSFQPLPRVDQLLRAGVLTGDWTHIMPRAERAYAAMVAAMAAHSIDCAGKPPIWAWHRPLRLLDAYLLFDADELATGFATLTVDAPDALVLLSDYSDWCDVLFDSAVNWQPRPPTGDLHPPQATLPLLRAEWVLDWAPLPVTGWDDLDLEGEV